MSTPPIKTLLWDLDGTLIDSFGISHELYKEILPEHGQDAPSRWQLRQNYHGTLDETVRSITMDGTTDAEVTAIVADFLQRQNAHYEDMAGHIYADALLLATRAQDQGLRQIVVTNRHHEGRDLASPRSIVERTALRAMIDAVICGDDTEFNKPDARVVQYIDFDPETTVVIGDQLVDVKLAHNIGARAVVVLRSDKAHPHAHGLAEFSNFTLVQSLEEYSL